MLVERAGDLGVDQRFREGGQEFVGLGKGQAQGVGGQLVAAEGEHLGLDRLGGVVAGVHGDPHSDLHEGSFLPRVPRSAFTAALSKRSMRAQYSSAGSSSRAS